MDNSVQAYVSRLLGLVGQEKPMSILSATASTVSRLVASVDAATLARKPEPSKWSVNEIVAHLADAEIVGSYRFRMILATNGTPLQAYDQDHWASTFNYASLDARVSAQLFSAYRLGNLRLLNTVSPTLLDNHGVHEERGSESLRQLVMLFAGHDRNHLQQIERNLNNAQAATTRIGVPPKPEIPLDIVDKLDLRVGTIVEVADVSGADRLVRLTVSFGSDTRTVIAGIKEERSDPRILVGRQALFYYNLPHRTIRGHDSQAMLCDVGYADGLLPALLVPEWPVPDGTRAG